MFYRLRSMSHTATKRVFGVAFKAFLDMVHELLQKFLAGIHFLLFKTTLQRGGTCAAHGIKHFAMRSMTTVALLASLGASLGAPKAPLSSNLVPLSPPSGINLAFSASNHTLISKLISKFSAPTCPPSSIFHGSVTRRTLTFAIPSIRKLICWNST